MQTSDNQMQLPNGLVVHYLDQAELSALYDEIFVRGAYMKHLSNLRDGDVVLDVGANIGLFSLYAAQQAKGLTIHAFEPIPRVAELLEQNLRAHGVNATVHRCAVSDGEGEVTFMYYPTYSLMSGLHTDPVNDEAISRTCLSNMGLGEHADAMLAGRFARDTIRTERRTLSKVIRDYGISEIGLLKVDAERAEHEVLAGLSDTDWSKIRQLVVEVHDIGRRVDAIRAELERRGYEITAEQDPTFIGTEIFTVYATRQES